MSLKSTASILNLTLDLYSRGFFDGDNWRANTNIQIVGLKLCPESPRLLVPGPWFQHVFIGVMPLFQGRSLDSGIDLSTGLSWTKVKSTAVVFLVYKQRLGSKIEQNNRFSLWKMYFETFSFNRKLIFIIYFK